jgi:hypothetical protein
VQSTHNESQSLIIHVSHTCTGQDLCLYSCRGIMHYARLGLATPGLHTVPDVYSLLKKPALPTRSCHYRPSSIMLSFHGSILFSCRTVLGKALRILSDFSVQYIMTSLHFILLLTTKCTYLKVYNISIFPNLKIIFVLTEYP